MEWLVMSLALSLAAGLSAEPPPVFFQAHRGGLDEVPENTLAAYEHAWAIPGAVPEVDLCTTADGVVVCMHDDTPERTTDAPEPWAGKKMSEIPLDEVRKWDAGKKFDAKYAEERVPTLDEVLDRVKGRPERQVYLDLKNIDLEKLRDRLREYGVEKQVIFVHGSPAMCARLHALYEGARTMTWLSGPPDKIKRDFAKMCERGFRGISQIQFHLPPLTTSPQITYAFDDVYIKEAVRLTRAAGVDLQLRPFAFDAPSLRSLLDAGVHWYVTDAPKSFAECVRAAQTLPAERH